LKIIPQNKNPKAVEKMNRSTPIQNQPFSRRKKPRMAYKIGRTAKNSFRSFIG